MVDTALRSLFVRIQFLLVVTASLLSGLVFGRDYGGEAFYAVVSFAVLVSLTVIAGQIQSSASK